MPVEELRITYDATNGTAIRDGQADMIAEMLIHKDGLVCFETASSSLITSVRVAIKKGLIPFQKVTFVFDGKEIKPDVNGRLPEWPKGFCDHESIRLAILSKRN